MIPLKHWPAVVLTLGILAVVSVAVFATCKPTPSPIPEREQRTADSLDITKPAYVARRDTVVRVESIYVAQSRHEAAQSSHATHAADSLHEAAIAWQRAAEAQGDTASRWYQVAKVERIENDSLRSANTVLLRALEHQTLATTAADARAADADRRAAALEDFNHRVVADLKRADPPCRVFYVAKCPSREVVAVASVGGTLIGIKVAPRIAKAVKSLVTGRVP